MFRKQNPNPSKRTNLSQFGLLDIPDLNEGDDNLDMSDDDMDLEAELAAISGGEVKHSRPKKPAGIPGVNLDAMIAESLRDVPSDEDIGSGDEDDPELLNELRQLSVEEDDAPPPPPRASRAAPPPPAAAGAAASGVVTLLHERIANYSLAESNAKANGESSRARRFNRGLKTLNDLLKQAKAGKPISEEDIPPPVSAGRAAGPAERPPPVATPPVATPPVESPSAPVEDPVSSAADVAPTPPEELMSFDEPVPPPPPPVGASPDDPEKQQGLQIILKRKEEFKAAALAAKQSDKPLALELLKVVKQFELVLAAYSAGEPMDLAELPTPHQVAAAFREQQGPAEPTPTPSVDASGLITASSMDEALRQRLAVYQEQEAKAKEANNSSKQRRMARIVKQFEDAIRLHAAGRPVPADELPTPPGYGPLPGAESAPAPALPAPPAPPARPAPPSAGRPAAKAAQATRADKQLAFLMTRQKEFRDAALRAKKTGNITEAKEYLRAAKGFDAVIEAARGGLAVDLKSLPVPPRAKRQLEQTFDIVSAEDCAPPEEPSASIIDLEGDDVLASVQQPLTAQLKLCLANRDHYKQMGNVAETNRFENLAVSVKQDLDVVNVAKRLGQNPPKFHYESRQFSVVQCNTDLNENDLELTIIRGIAFNVPNPKEVDTYVKFEFPYPQDAPVCDRTPLVKDSNSPEFNATFPLAISRRERACQRVFRRHAIKLEVYSRGGWFSKDALLGTASVKLEPLESRVTLHEAFPLMSGRRAAGGSLEVRLRVRTPLVQQQFDNSTHRWLVVDH